MKITIKDMDRIWNYLGTLGAIVSISFAGIIGVGLALLIMSAMQNLVWKSYAGLFLLIIGCLVGWFDIRLFKYQDKFNTYKLSHNK